MTRKPSRTATISRSTSKNTTTRRSSSVRASSAKASPTPLLVPKKISSSTDMTYGSAVRSFDSSKAVVVHNAGLVQKTNGAAERSNSSIVARPVLLRDAPILLREGHPQRPAFTTVVTKFEVGDKVVYPGHGVGQIETIEAKSIAGTEQQFFGITIIESGMKVLVPVAQAPSIGLRRVVDRKAVDEVYAILKRRDIRIDTQTWNRRFREYSLKLKTGSVFEIAEVMRDLSVLSSDKELSFGEKKMFDTAENLLVAEVAIVKARPADKIKAEFKALMS